MGFVGADATLPLQLTGPNKGLRIDQAAKRVFIGGHELIPLLSVAQYRLLELLLDHEGEVVSRDAIVVTVWPEEEAMGISEQAIDALVVDSFGMPSLTGFAPGKTGVSITFPDGDARPPKSHDAGDHRAWWAFSRYENEGETGYGLWSFSRDGATPNNGSVETWFELMDAWYDDPAAGPGGLNRYSW